MSTASFWSSEDAIFTVKIDSTDVAIIYVILFCVASLLSAIVTLSYCHANHYLPICIQDTLGCRVTEHDGQLMKSMIYFLQTWVLFGGIYLTSAIIRDTILFAIINNDKYITWMLLLAMLSPIFIIIPCLTKINFAMTLSRDKTINNLSRLYFREHSIFFGCLVLISGCHGAIQLASSRMFGVDIFDCGLNKIELLQLGLEYQQYFVVIEHIPQLIIQIVYIVYLGCVDQVVLCALIPTALSIILALFARRCTQIKFKNHDIITLRVDLSSKNFRMDQIEFIKRLGYRKKLRNEIANSLSIQREQMEVFKLIPTAAGCIVSIGYTRNSGFDSLSEPSASYTNDIYHEFTIDGTSDNETKHTLIHKLVIGCKSMIPMAMMRVWKLSSPPFVTYVDKPTVLQRSSSKKPATVTVVPGFGDGDYAFFEVDETDFRQKYPLIITSYDDRDVITYALTPDEIKRIEAGLGEAIPQEKQLDLVLNNNDYGDNAKKDKNCQIEIEFDLKEEKNGVVVSEIETLNKASDIGNYQDNTNWDGIIAKTRDHNDSIYRDYVAQNLSRTDDKKHNHNHSPNVIVDSDINECVMGRWLVDNIIIGKGTFACVYKGVDINHESIAVAVKLMSKQATKTINSGNIEWAARNEITCLSKISHQNVVKLMSYDTDTIHKNQKVVILVLEFAKHGELTDLLFTLKRFDEILARTYFRQVLSGLEACHKVGIVHRDIKIQNILLDWSYNIKICDFGLSKLTTNKDLSIKSHLVGTPGFTAPEVLKKQDYNSLCDIFSAGIVLFIMLTGRRPFGKVVIRTHGETFVYDTKYQLFIDDNAKYWQKLTDYGISVSNAAKVLLSALLHDDPSSRLQSKHVVYFSWYNGDYLKSQDIARGIRRRFLNLQDRTAEPTSHKDQKNQHIEKRVKKDPQVLIYTGKLPTLPSNATEEYGDIYTSTDWRIVYHTIATFMTEKLKGTTTYQEDEQILVCTANYPDKVKFGFRMFESTKWEQTPNAGDSNANGKVFVYKVHIKRLSGDESKLKEIQSLLFKDKVFAAIPDWAQSQAKEKLRPKSKVEKEKEKENKHDHDIDSNNKDDDNIGDEFKDQVSNLPVGSTFTTETSQYRSLLSGLSLISDSAASMNSKTDLTYYISDPLVILLSVGDYDKNVMPSLIGATKDYVNCIYTFYYLFGFSLVYQNKITNKLEYLKKQATGQDKTGSKKNKLSLHECKENVKTRWTEDEIDNFFDNAQKKVLTNKHDACIFIISAHGEKEGMILDSEGEKVNLGLIFGYFNGKYCQYLLDKPKIIFVDGCRGSMKAKPIDTVDLQIEATAYTDNKSNVSTTTVSKNNKNTDPKTDNICIDKSIKENALSAVVHAKCINDRNRKITKNMILINGKYYHEQSNFRYIYGNPEGYSVPDGGIKGGYLIRGIKKVFSNFEISLNKNLDEMVNKIRTEVSQMVGKGAQMAVEDVNTMTYKIMFQRKTKGS